MPEECEAADVEGPAKPTIFVVAPTRRQAPVPFTQPAKAAVKAKYLQNVRLELIELVSDIILQGKA